jgi:hypothetical protein
MPNWAWIVIGVGAAVVLLAVAWAWIARRRKHLREHFGPEYERTVSESGDRREAESELARREKRRNELDIRPLEFEERTEYRKEWQRVQAEFVDSPEEAVREADSVIGQVMRDRGYPVEDFDTRSADISVDHPDVVQNYRAAHRISELSDRGDATTEDLRMAMVHYRSLFVELVETGEPVGQEAR